MEKKHLILLIALLAIGFACYVLFGPNGKTVTVEKIVYKDSITGKTDTIILGNDKDVCLNYENYSPSELPSGTILNLVNNYRANQLAAINADASKGITDDAHSIWFDMDTIKKFIYHIEQGVKKNNGVGSILGLRFYYASYPSNFIGFSGLEDFRLDPIKSTYTKRHTLVILPTITKGSHIYDFNPNDAATFKNGLPSFRNSDRLKDSVMSLTPTFRMASSIRGTPEQQTNARNHGQLAPPYPADGITGEAF